MNFKYKAKKRTKAILQKIKAVLLNIKPPKYYEKKAIHFFERNDNKKAFKALEKGMKFYPNSLLINRQYAIFFTSKEQWEKAGEFWGVVFKSPNKKLLCKKNYETAAYVYEQMSKPQKAINVYKLGLKRYKNDSDLLIQSSKLLLGQKNYKKVITSLEPLLIHDNNLSIEFYLYLAKAYKETGYYDKSEYLLRHGLVGNQNSTELISNYVDIAIEKKQWEKAKIRIEYYLSKFQITKEMLIKLSMLYQITGKASKASEIFDQVMSDYKSECINDIEGYRRITLFDNGETRIDFYKKLEKVEKVILSFDSLYMNWNELPFGFKLLRKQQLDIIAIRKRKKGYSQQDLTQEEFKNAVSTLVKDYDDKIAYGHSLGGYTSLYYASNINCRILSLAPRLSIHPKYGKVNKKAKEEFKHNLTHNYNDQIKPIIVFDPKDKLDSRYVQDELLKFFPNAILIKLPYGGHGIARHLLRMGTLKEYILKVIDGEIPEYDRSLKANSGNYCRLLGRKCLNQNKLKWADSLSERAADLLPKDGLCLNLRIDVLKKLDRYEEAIKFTKAAIKTNPKNLKIKFSLVDLYIETNELFKAEDEVNKIKLTNKEQKTVEKKLNSIDTKRKHILETPLYFIENNKSPMN